jgi:hypothetical protein
VLYSISAKGRAADELLWELAKSDAMILVLVRDLMFSSKITAAAREVGAAVKIVRDPAALSEMTGDRLIVDLNQAGALEAAMKWKSAAGGAVIGFVSHVDADTIAKAQQSGIDRVLSRGQFTQLLPNLLQNS